MLPGFQQMLFLHFLVSLISTIFIRYCSIPFLLQNLHTSASTILSVFPLANHFQNTQSLGEYAWISAAAVLDGGKEMGPFSRKLSSVHLPSGVCGTYHLYTILTTYHPECATPPSALLCGEECPMSV